MPLDVYPAIVAGQDLTASLMSGQEWTAWKTGPTSRASNVTPTADPDLSIPVVAGATYDIRGILGYTADGPVNSGSPGGIQFTLTAPAGSAGGWSAIGDAPGTVLAPGIFPFTAWGGTHAFNGRGATASAAIIEGTLLVGATPGNLALSWCQAGSDATPTVLLAGCKLVARRATT